MSNDTIVQENDSDVYGKQSTIIDAMQDKITLNLLHNVTELVKKVPANAVDIIMQFKEIDNVMEKCLTRMEQTIQRMDEIKKVLPELTTAAKKMVEINKMVESIDESKVLNRYHRLVQDAQTLKELRENGTFELLEKISRIPNDKSE